MKRGGLLQGLLAAGLLLLLGVLFFNGRSAIDRTHTEVLQRLDEILRAHAGLHVHALLNRAGLLHHYDEINLDLRQMHAAQTALVEALQHSPITSSGALSQAADEIAESIAEVESLAEEFKSANAITQNSLMYFSLGSKQILDEVDDSKQDAIDGLLAKLVGDMLRFLRNPSSEAAATIAPLLESLDAQGGASTRVQLLRRHGQKILEMLPVLTGLIERMQQSSVPSRVLQFTSIYRDEHQRVERRAAGYRVASFVVSLMLAAYLVHLFMRNRAHVRALAESNLALAREKGQAEATLTSITDGVVTLDCDGLTRYLNPVAMDMLAISEAEYIGKPLSDVVKLADTDGDALSDRILEHCLNQQDPLHWKEGHILTDSLGGQRIVELSASPMAMSSGQRRGCVLVFHDVSETRALIERISHQAVHDDLTGLVNRSEFERRLAQAIDEASDTNHRHVLCYLDLDQFKVVNDTCGHAAGDQLLVQVSHLLQTGIRNADTLARLGGDEFGILLKDCDISKAAQITEHLRSLVQDFRFVWEERMFDIGISVGLVAIDAETSDTAQAMSQVDMACYTAKDLGRNRVHIYHQHDTELRRRETELQWASRITSALEDERLKLFGQRIQRTGHSSSSPAEKYEILLRLQDDDGNLVAPGAFIPAAERYNLMHLVDRWVIQQALGVLACIPQDCCPQFSINLSGNSISDDQLLPFITRQLEMNDIPPSKVCFEITETAAILNMARAIELIDALKALGCEFSLDDFGAGLSSFSYLKSLPVDYVKIDGSFVRDMRSDPIDRAMVESINQVGHIMGKLTVAEFVEDAATMEALRVVGVDYVQGYGVGKPRPLDSVLSELQKH